MLIAATESEERITTAHRAKLAYVYVRQSTAGQVRQHQESTQLQYRLVERAALLGWPRDRIEVIDDDLGKSGASSDARYGFQRLIAEIGLGKAGLVLSSMRRAWRATIAIGINFWNCAPCSEPLSPMANDCTTQVSIMIVCCLACRGS